MNVQTKEFWLKVKEEYNPKKNAPIDISSICDTSPTFRKMWNNVEDTREDFLVIEHAELFLKEINYDAKCGTFYLFNNEDTELRKQFIDHMINKFS